MARGLRRILPSLIAMTSVVCTLYIVVYVSVPLLLVTARFIVRRTFVWRSNTSYGGQPMKSLHREITSA